MKPVKPAKKPIAPTKQALKTRLAPKKEGGQGRCLGEKAKTGRPTIKSQEILNAICAGISVGKSARAMCVEVSIANSSLWKWLNENKEFSEQYARAKDDCADYLAAEIIEIADDGSRDYAVTEDGREVPDHDHIARSRLRVDARKWYASKLAPKRYGDKMDVDHGIQAGSTLETLANKLIGSVESRIKVE